MLNFNVFSQYVHYSYVHTSTYLIYAMYWHYILVVHIQYEENPLHTIFLQHLLCGTDAHSYFYPNAFFKFSLSVVLPVFIFFPPTHIFTYLVQQYFIHSFNQNYCTIITAQQQPYSPHHDRIIRSRHHSNSFDLALRLNDTFKQRTNSTGKCRTKYQNNYVFIF